MYHGKYQHARDHAVERARANRKPYVVFLDTSGNYRTEPFDPSLSSHRSALDIFFPDAGTSAERLAARSL